MKKIFFINLILTILLLVLLNACSNLINKNIESNEIKKISNTENENQIILGEPRIVPDVPKDAIPPLNFPKYLNASEANFLRGSDLVIGININNDARAYPIKILNWHEIVNDKVGGKDVVVTYCPLCRSAILFDRNVGNQILNFGNTGSLYESTMLMYDLETESYWAQIGGRAIQGKLEGKRLKPLPSTTTRWKDWKNLYPETLVLSRETGFVRNYGTDPYESYDNIKESLPPFPLSLIDKRLSPKELILGVEFNNIQKAYPIDLLGWNIINDKVSGNNIALFTRPKLSNIFYSELNGKNLEFELINNSIFDKNTGSQWNFFGTSINGSLKGKKLEQVPSVYAFWFGWVAEYPETELFELGDQN